MSDRLLAIALGVLLGVVAFASFAAGVADERTNHPQLPACPYEDTCEVDYRDGAWWLRTYDDHRETTPGPWVRVSE